MSSSKETRHPSSSADEEVAKPKRFYYPGVRQGVTVLAASQEEADAQIAAMLEKKSEEIPAKKEVETSNE